MFNSELCKHIVGKISIAHVTIFLSKYISKGAIDMNFSPILQFTHHKYPQRGQGEAQIG